MEIASDTHGTLWATSFNSGLLLRFNPQTATFTSYYAPASGNSPGGIYGLAIGPSGEIWFTMPAQNTIARFDVTRHRFVYYPIPTKASLPLGLVMGNNQTVWFTEAGSDKIGMLKP
jgi:virginiamycin B lyase